MNSVLCSLHSVTITDPCWQIGDFKSQVEEEVKKSLVIDIWIGGNLIKFRWDRKKV